MTKIDQLEVEKLPEAVKDGKSISDEQRAKIKELSVPITDEQIEEWKDDGYGEIDPDTFVKPDYDHYTNSNGVKIEYLPAEKLEKYKALCDELDAANAAALPYYQHVAEQDQAVAQNAQQHLQQEIGRIG